MIAFDVFLVRLNVFTRDLVVAKRRPVVVWIHGGSFSRFQNCFGVDLFMIVWLVAFKVLLGKSFKFQVENRQTFDII